MPFSIINVYKCIYYNTVDETNNDANTTMNKLLTALQQIGGRMDSLERLVHPDTLNTISTQNTTGDTIRIISDQ